MTHLHLVTDDRSTVIREYRCDRCDESFVTPGLLRMHDCRSLVSSFMVGLVVAIVTLAGSLLAMAIVGGPK